MPTAAAKLAPLLVTALELTEIADWERKYAKAKKAAAEAEREVEFRRLALAEKVLGVNSKEDLKVLTPEQVEKRFKKRLEAGDWKVERGSPEFSFVKTHSGRYPSWRDEFIGVQGETAAARISAETPTIYSYAVEVSPS